MSLRILKQFIYCIYFSNKLKEIRQKYKQVIEQNVILVIYIEIQIKKHLNNLILLFIIDIILTH